MLWYRHHEMIGLNKEQIFLYIDKLKSKGIKWWIEEDDDWGMIVKYMHHEEIRYAQ